MNQRRDTLLNFLTETSDLISTRKFQKILAADDRTKQLKEEIDKYYKLYHKGNEPLFKGVDTDQPFVNLPGTNWLQKGLKKTFVGAPREIRGSFRAAKGLDIDPLNMSPEELSRLLRVERGAREEITLEEIELLPEWFKAADWVTEPRNPREAADKKKAAVELQQKISKFYNKNRLDIDNPSDLKFDENNFKLSVHKMEVKLAQHLLYQLGIKPEHIKKILGLGEKSKRIADPEVGVEEGKLKLFIPLERFHSQDLEGLDPGVLQKILNDSLIKIGRTEKTAKIVVKDQKPFLEFNGHEDTFFRLLREFSGLSDGVIRSLVANKNQYKVKI